MKCRLTRDVVMGSGEPTLKSSRPPWDASLALSLPFELLLLCRGALHGVCRRRERKVVALETALSKLVRWSLKGQVWSRRTEEHCRGTVGHSRVASGQLMLSACGDNLRPGLCAGAKGGTTAGSYQIIVFPIPPMFFLEVSGMASFIG